MATQTKTRKTYTKKTAEERQADTKAAHDKLAAQVETLTTSEGWKNYLRFAARFHSYSFSNVMMIQAQYPGATQVAGFRKWQSLGRSVRKGEKSIKIFGFSRKVEEDEVTGELRERIFYPLLSVFDIAQTDITDQAKWDRVAPATTAATLEGEDEEGMGDRIAEFLGTRGWQVIEEDLKGGLEGYADPKRKVVSFRTGTAPAERASTLAHEAAHVVDGHTEDPAEYHQHRGKMEAIAESTAFVLGDAFGIDTSTYSVGYIAGWAKGDAALVRETAEAVLRTAKIILAAIAPAEEVGAE